MRRVRPVPFLINDYFHEHLPNVKNLCRFVVEVLCRVVIVVYDGRASAERDLNLPGKVVLVSND